MSNTNSWNLNERKKRVKPKRLLKNFKTVENKPRNLNQINKWKIDYLWHSEFVVVSENDRLFSKRSDFSKTVVWFYIVRCVYLEYSILRFFYICFQNVRKTHSCVFSNDVRFSNIFNFWFFKRAFDFQKLFPKLSKCSKKP